ncbi:hypothetical protein BVX97_04070 [bacterium E08(2017)]|nr:hypothetical protein BVX97_04070 [bacterium E08(2017)]
MEPLSIAALSALTPFTWEKIFYDDRMESIPYDEPTDLVAISIETFTAKRGYEIADIYRDRGVPVVMGGYHATFCSDEALEHADAVCVGDAEKVWMQILQDAERGSLGGIYSKPVDIAYSAQFDRSIFAGKDYFKLSLMETSRGCRYDCSFCSISAFQKGKCKHRPVNEVVAEIEELNKKAIFFIDDNIVSCQSRAIQLFTALRNQDINWVGQASLDMIKSPAMLDLMAESGCIGLLIGFESLSDSALAGIRKGVNRAFDYSQALSALRKRGIVVYGTFLAGLPEDTRKTLDEAVDFAREEKLFIAAFNHVVPFPGTKLYDEVREKGKLLYDKWWLSNEYRFGDVPFSPDCGSADQLADWCQHARRTFYSTGSIWKRLMDYKANAKTLKRLGYFLTANLLLKSEVSRRKGLRLGCAVYTNGETACQEYRLRSQIEPMTKRSCA